MRVTLHDVRQELIVPGGRKAQYAFDAWKIDRRYSGEVVPFVVSFDQEYLFTIKRTQFDEVKAVIESNPREHALLGVSSSDNIALTKNLNTPWAFVQLFHRYLQERQSLPTWLEWRDWLRNDAKDLFAVPASRRVHFGRLDEFGKEAIKRGLNWRLGNVYYSCMRELDVLIRLRDEYELPVKYHILADALFRVDYWRGLRTACLFVSNDEMKAAQAGRKDRPAKFLAKPPFEEHYEAVMEKQHTYGNLHLATDKTVAGIAAALR